MSLVFLSTVSVIVLKKKWNSIGPNLVKSNKRWKSGIKDEK